MSLRWNRHALSTVRRAAQMQGVPYQTYVKAAAFRQAIADLKDAAAALADAG